MNYLIDLVLLAIFLLEVIICYIRGFAKSTWKLISVVTAGVISYLFGSRAGQLLFLDMFSSDERIAAHAPLLADILGYLSLFAVSLVLMSVLGIAVKKAAKTEVLNALDSVLGGVFGAVIGLVIVSVLCIVLSFLIELKLPGEKMALLEEAANKSYIFCFFCDLAPFEYVNIRSVLSVLGR